MVLQYLPVLKSVKGVRFLFGISGYFLRFMNGFLKIVRPLSDLLVGSSMRNSKVSAF